MRDVAAIGSVAGLTGVAGAASFALLRRARPYLAAGHAIAPATAVDPLPEVLRLGLGGMTVPVRPGPHGELYLGPGAPQPGRTLRRLVLAPLFAAVQAGGGRLHRDQRTPFRLVVEFAGPNRDPVALLHAYRMLDQQLRDHAALLSRCEDGVLAPGMVAVTVCGIVDARELLAAQPLRFAFAECTFDDLGPDSAPPALVPAVSEPWSHRFGWDGAEPISAEERHQLHALVRAAHADGRTVCLRGLAAGPRRARVALWTELGAAGVDVIADTDLRGLARHLRRSPVSGPPGPQSPSYPVRRTKPRPHVTRREPV